MSSDFHLSASLGYSGQCPQFEKIKLLTFIFKSVQIHLLINFLLLEQSVIGEKSLK